MRWDGQILELLEGGMGKSLLEVFKWLLGGMGKPLLEVSYSSDYEVGWANHT